MNTVASRRGWTCVELTPAPVVCARSRRSDQPPAHECDQDGIQVNHDKQQSRAVSLCKRRQNRHCQDCNYHEPEYPIAWLGRSAKQLGCGQASESNGKGRGRRRVNGTEWLDQGRNAGYEPCHPKSDSSATRHWTGQKSTHYGEHVAEEKLVPMPIRACGCVAALPKIQPRWDGRCSKDRGRKEHCPLRAVPSGCHYYRTDRGSRLPRASDHPSERATRKQLSHSGGTNPEDVAVRVEVELPDRVCARTGSSGGFMRTSTFCRRVRARTRGVQALCAVPWPRRLGKQGTRRSGDRGRRCLVRRCTTRQVQEWDTRLASR